MNRAVARSIAMICLLAACGIARGEGPSGDEVRAYIDKIAATHNKLKEAGIEFGKTIGPALSGNNDDLLATYRKYRHIVKVLNAGLKDTASWKVPDHQAVKELARANDKFMAFQVDMMLGTVPTLLDVLEDRTLDKEAKIQRIQNIVASGNEAEQKIGMLVRDALTKAARAFKLDSNE